MTASARRQAVRRSRTSPRACRSQTGCRSQAGGRGRRPARPGCLSLADKTRTRRRHARLGGGVRRQAAGAAARSAAGSDAGTGVRARSAVLSSEPRSVGANTACPASRREAVTASQHQPSANPRGPKRTAPQAPSPRATASSPRGRARRCLERKAQIIVRIHTEQSAGGLTRQRSASAGSGTRRGCRSGIPVDPACDHRRPAFAIRLCHRAVAISDERALFEELEGSGRAEGPQPVGGGAVSPPGAVCVSAARSRQYRELAGTGTVVW
jgi:hypothetical protein